MKVSRIACLRVIAAVFSRLILLTSMTACGDREANERIKAHCEAVLDALLANDLPTAQTMLSQVSEEGIREFAAEIAPLLEGVSSYELKQTGWHFHTENGVTRTTMTYRMKCDNGRVLLVEGVEVTGVENLAGFGLQMPEEQAGSAVLLPIRIVFIAISTAVTAFCVWMIVDCARRRMKRKALWIIFILVNVMFVLTVDGGIHFRTTFGLILARSSLYLDSITKAFQLSFAVPIGAIIYFILRHSLSLPTDPPQEEQLFETDAK